MLNKNDLRLYTVMEQIIAMDKIVHLDELHTKDFIDFVRLFEDMSEEVTISEKIDGQNISFGLDEENTFFTKSKKSPPVTDVSFYTKFDFMSSFADIHNILESRKQYLLKIKEYVREHTPELSVEPFTFQVFCEMLPKPQTNTVLYNKDKIGNGALIVINIVINGKQIAPTHRYDKIQRMLLNYFNNWGGIKVYPKPVLHTEDSKINVHHVVTLERLLGKYHQVLKSRKHVDKAIKERAKHTINLVKLSIKNQVLRELNSVHTSVFGALEPEGYVVESANKLIKIVDKDTFITENKENQQHIVNVRNEFKRVRKDIQETIFGNADILTNIPKIIENVNQRIVTESIKGKVSFTVSKDVVLETIIMDIKSEKRIDDNVHEYYNIVLNNIKKFEKFVKEEQYTLKHSTEVPENVKKINEEYIQETLTLIKNFKINFYAALAENNKQDILYCLLEIAIGPATLQKLKNEFKFQTPQGDLTPEEKQFVYTFVQNNKKLFTEGTSSTAGSGGLELDDGPRFIYKNRRNYKKAMDVRARQLGYEVANYLLFGSDENTPQELNDDPVDSVSFFPAGDLNTRTSTNQQDIQGMTAVRKWYKHVTKTFDHYGFTVLQSPEYFAKFKNKY